MDEPTQKCSECGKWLDFPFGVGTMSAGICGCRGIIYQFDSAKRELRKCSVQDAWGSSRYVWSRVDLVP